MFLLTMCLNAMDMPKISFYCTVVSAALNIFLSLLLIPRFGIAGAAVASLVSITMNAVLAYAMLKSSIRISVDLKSVKNLVLSALVMSGILLGCVYLFPVQSFAGLVLVLLLGAGVYFSTVLALDRKIRNDLKSLLETMDLPGT